MLNIHFAVFLKYIQRLTWGSRKKSIFFGGAATKGQGPYHLPLLVATTKKRNFFAASLVLFSYLQQSCSQRPKLLLLIRIRVFWSISKINCLSFLHNLKMREKKYAKLYLDGSGFVFNEARIHNPAQNQGKQRKIAQFARLFCGFLLASNCFRCAKKKLQI